MAFLPFHSRDLFFKSKFGAVKTGEKLRFRLLLPRSFFVSAAAFVLTKDGETPVEHGMYWAGMHGADCEIWDLELALPDRGLYFYHFAYDSAWGRGAIYHIGDGAGAVANAVTPQNDWQLTVYDANYQTPDWLKGGVMYQIFPDRFYNSGKEKKNVPADRILRTDTENQPYWRPDKNGKVLNNDYFGGDLAGITEKLPYLKDLGVTCIYLNPIFEAHSNHRYNTADYLKIDPLLGDETDFKTLCETAKNFGIRVILDGVFSHTGDDSLYFNRAGRYKTLGAYNSEKSPYYPWYTFFDYPDSYKSWWGFETLPEVNEESPEYLEFITGKNGVVKKWLRLGAAGWRLDVADELPDAFLDALSASAKAEKADALVLGEVWEDATNKWAYGERRRYLLGGQLDSVMNYPFANAILNFARSGIAEGFARAVTDIVENYPKPALDCMMNHIGTHDTERAITKIMGESAEGRDREWQSQRVLSDADYQKGVTLLKLAATLQFTLPGVPCIYYGDEAGLQGYKDPFNRGCYPWGHENQDLIAFYQTLGALRGSLDCLKTGELHFVSAALGCVAYEREGDSDGILVIANRNEQAITYNLPDKWQYKREILHGAPVTSCVNVPPTGCVILNF
ncbi:MAG: glycoside hydrolase family 13 protein [Clostridia bacterium]|nr:glycoside hydrolase family 13 protein [Clostridia bacterium]